MRREAPVTGVTSVPPWLIQFFLMNHGITATDIAKLTVALIRDFPEEYSLYSQKEFRYNNITQSNRNRLLWLDPTVDGMKTGYTEAAARRQSALEPGAHDLVDDRPLLSGDLVEQA